MFNDQAQVAGSDKSGEVRLQNGPNSFQNAKIIGFSTELMAHSSKRTPPALNRFYLQNLDGRVVKGSEKEVLVATGLSRQQLYKLRTGRAEYAKHWKLMHYEENGFKRQIQQRGSKKKYYIFYRDRGPVQKGTRIEFCRLTGMDRNLVYSRIRKNLPIPGWQYRKA